MMVTLHHMTDETIHKTFENLQKIMKQNSLFIIKEHDCQSQEDRFVIDWDHHLYHLIESPMILDGDIDQYLREYISNFKSKYNFDLLLKQYDFSPIQELNRFFESEKDHKNATNLYWKIYMKM
jgi:hypothetical protein